MACQYRNGDHIPLNELDEWIEDALAAIEYAIGPTTSKWGARWRASRRRSATPSHPTR
jgi:hypothetical protein